MKRQDDRLPAHGLLGKLACQFLPVFVLLAPFLAFIQYHHYEVWRPEIAFIGLLVVAVGLILGLVMAKWPTTLGFPLAMLLIGLFLMVQVSILNIWTVQTVYRDSPLAALSGVGAVMALVILAWRIRRNLLLILSGGFAMICVSILILPPDRQANGSLFERAHETDRTLPPLLHIVFDGHIGIEGIPTDVPGGNQLRAEIKAFYQRYGFTLHGRAFSHWADTASSLATALNSRMWPDDLLGRQPGALITFSLSENLWFERLADQGYGLRIYQTNYMDFCQTQPGAVILCHQAPFNSISFLKEIELSTWQKMQVILSSFIYSVKSGIGIAPHPPRFQLGAINLSNILMQILADLIANPDNVAVFAHVMMPHHNHIMDSRCGIKQKVESWSTASDKADSRGSINTQATRRERYRDYFEQVRCLYRILGGFLDDLQRAGLLSRMTIIFQGDHGSRISTARPTKWAPESVSIEDLVDQYSTLYAVKRPGVPASYDSDLIAYQAEFSRTFLERDLSPSGPFVFLNGYNWATDEAPESLKLPDDVMRSGPKELVTE